MPTIYCQQARFIIRKIVLAIILLLLIKTSGAQTYFIVRHAEKVINKTSENMLLQDPPLTAEGRDRALALKELLIRKHIGYIFSTNTERTRATAKPLSEAISIPIEFYGPLPDQAFIEQLRRLNQNVLIVGHSNTVDDIVNMLCGKHLLKDLKDEEYDNLFVVTRSGKQYKFKKKKFGKKAQISRAESKFSSSLATAVRKVEPRAPSIMR